MVSEGEAHLLYNTLLSALLSLHTTHTHNSTLTLPGGAVFVPAFNGLFAPYWRTDARGVLVGLSGSVGRGHIARATLEAVAHQSRQVLETMDAEAHLYTGSAARSSLRSSPSPAPSQPPQPPRTLKVDGGMTRNNVLMQFQADVTGRTVIRPTVSETTSLGAAYAAGLAVGFWQSTEELTLHWKEAQRWTPALPPAEVALSCLQWERAVARSLNWSLQEDSVEGLRKDPALQLLPGGGGGAGGGVGCSAARGPGGPWGRQLQPGGRLQCWPHAACAGSRWRGGCTLETATDRSAHNNKKLLLFYMPPTLSLCCETPYCLRATRAVAGPAAQPAASLLLLCSACRSAAHCQRRQSRLQWAPLP